MPTPPPPNRRFLIGSLLSIVLAISAFLGWTLVRIDTLASEAAILRARSNALERAYVETPGIAAVHAEIAAIDTWLEANAPASASSATPSQWDASRDEVERALAPLEPFYERVDALFARPEPEVLALAGIPAPEKSSLESNRNWTNLLVTRALHDAGRGEWEATGRRIAQALDLASLRDPRTPVGASIRVSCEAIAIGALRLVLAGEDADPATLRAALEPALARAGDPRLAGAAVAGELARWSDEGRAIPRRCLDRCTWLGRPPHFAWAQGELAAYTEVVEEALRLARGQPCSALDAGGRLVLAHTSIEHEAYAAKTCLEIGLLAQSRVALARIALAASAHRQARGAAPARLEELAYLFGGELPRDPCSKLPLGYESREEEIVVGPPAFAAVRALDAVQASALLLRWSLAPNWP